MRAFRRSCTRCARNVTGASATSPIWRPSRSIVGRAGARVIGTQSAARAHPQRPAGGEPVLAVEPPSYSLRSTSSRRRCRGFRPNDVVRGPTLGALCVPPRWSTTRAWPGLKREARSKRLFARFRRASRAARVPPFRPRRRRSAAARRDFRRVDGALRSEGLRIAGGGAAGPSNSAIRSRSGDRVRPAERVAGRFLLLPAVARARAARGRARRGWPHGAAASIATSRSARDRNGADDVGGPRDLASARHPRRAPRPAQRARPELGPAAVVAAALRDAATHRSRRCYARTCAHAGVLRIDHVMALMRPSGYRGAPAREGAYVRYPSRRCSRSSRSRACAPMRRRRRGSRQRSRRDFASGCSSARVLSAAAVLRTRPRYAFARPRTIRRSRRRSARTICRRSADGGPAPTSRRAPAWRAL